MLLTVGIVRGTEPAPGNEIEIVYMSRERPVLMHVLLPSQEAPLPTRWNEWMTDWFSFLDRDSSGVLDRAEFDRSPSPSQVLAQRRAGLYPRLGDVGADFKAADLDGSSSIDREELTTYYRTGGVGPLDVIAGQCDMAWAETLTAEMFEALDRDGDGGLSGGELRQAMESLGRLDADDDELIMVSEIMPTPPPPRIETVSSRFLIPTLGAHSWEQETRSLADALSMHYGVDIDARTLRRRRPDVTCLVELTRGERGGSVVGDGKRVEAASRFGLADAIVALHPAPTPRGVAPGVRDFFLQQVRNASRIDPDRNAWKRWATDRFALLALVE
ncbi:MAG: EF-hand domain-containing protein, partial [Planctomycetia bacterium]